MMRIFLAAAVVIGAAAFDLRNVQAHEAPWCAVIDMGNGAVYWDCQYATHRGLRAERAGRQSRLLQ